MNDNTYANTTEQMDNICAHDMGFNKLYYWLEYTLNADTTVIGGSATPGLSLNHIIKLSTDPETTKRAFEKIFEINFRLGSHQGDPKLRETITTDLYNTKLSRLSADDIIITNGTTGANHIVHQSLLKPSDHVICQYPIYGPCIEEPEAIGCDVSYLELSPTDGWATHLRKLEALIRPGITKLLMINNPHNPTGTYIDSEKQKDVVELCKKHDIIIHSDEIFRPLFHDDKPVPTSMIEHGDADYDKVVVTASLSKVYGLSGVRIGWVATKSAELRKTLMSYRNMSLSSVSLADELIATEVLSPRCRPVIHQKHLELAKTNLALVQELIDRYPDQCEWVRPTAGAVGFIKFKDPRTGEAVDDLQFCKDVFERKNVLLSPASLCFDFGPRGDSFKGRVRLGFTCLTENLQKGLKSLDEFLRENQSGKRMAETLSIRSRV